MKKTTVFLSYPQNGGCEEFPTFLEIIVSTAVIIIMSGDIVEVITVSFQRGTMIVEVTRIVVNRSAAIETAVTTVACSVVVGSPAITIVVLVGGMPAIETMPILVAITILAIVTNVPVSCFHLCSPNENHSQNSRCADDEIPHFCFSVIVKSVVCVELSYSLATLPSGKDYNDGTQKRQ